MWKKEKRFVVYVYTHFAPLESLSIIKLKCQDSNGFKLNRSPPKLRPEVCVSPELPPFTFAMAGDNCWMVADLLWEHNNKRLRKRFHVFFSPYVSILSVNYMKINMFRVQRDAPRRITIVCLLTIYVHLIKFILRKSVWDWLPFQRRNEFPFLESRLHKFLPAKGWKVYSAGLQWKHNQRQQTQQHTRL